MSYTEITTAELLKPTEILVLDLMEYVTFIDKDPYFDALIEPASGVYLAGGFDPIMSMDNPCYPISKMGMEYFAITTIEGMLRCKEVIVNNKGVVIGDVNKVRRIVKHMTNEPQLPVVMLKVMMGILTNYLSNLCTRTRHNINVSKYYRYIKPEYEYLITEERYETVLDNLIMDIIKFVGKDTYHIYFTRLKGTSVIVEKTIDYRIFEWYQYKAKENGHDLE
jgi:hypothetical protein